MNLTLRPLGLSFEPWEVPRATWNDLVGRSLIGTLPLRSLEEIEVERGKIRYDAAGIYREFCKLDKDNARETWGDTYKKAEWVEMGERLRKLDAEYATTREILMGRWSAVYDPAGRELVTARGGNPDTFRETIVSLADQHERAVREAIAEGKPVPLYVRRDYQDRDLDGGYTVAKEAAVGN